MNFQQYIVQDSAEEIRESRRDVSRIFLSLLGAWLITEVIFIALSVVFYFNPSLYDNMWLIAIVNSLITPTVILFFVIFQKNNKGSKLPATDSMTFKTMLWYLMAAIALMFTGALTGNLLNEFISFLMGNEISNPVEEMISELDYGPIILSTVIFAPVFEELLFRKLLIDRISKYGTFFCVVVSGVSFGMFHGNFYQFFYASALGMLLAYVYCVHGKVIYTMILHSVINIIGSVVPMLIEQINSENAESVYYSGYLCVVVTGWILLVKIIKRCRNYSVDGILMKPAKSLLNSGVIAFTLWGTVVFAINIFVS